VPVPVRGRPPSHLGHILDPSQQYLGDDPPRLRACVWLFLVPSSPPTRLVLDSARLQTRRRRPRSAAPASGSSMPAVGSGQAHILSLHVSLVLRAHSYRPLPTFLCQNHRAPHPKASPSAPQATYHADGHVHGHVPCACCQPTGPRAVPAIGRASFASGHALNRPPPPVGASPRPPLRLLSAALSIIASPALLAHAALSHGHDTDRPPGLDRARAALNSACAVCARAAPKPIPSATLDRAPPRPPPFPRARRWTSSRSWSTVLSHSPALARAALHHNKTSAGHHLKAH
jgi:hypothetical protein